LVRIGILYDILRAEEKMLIREATSRNIKLDLIRVCTKPFELNGGDRDDSEIFLQRCISYFRRLHSTGVLELGNRRVVNNLMATFICGNKAFTTMALASKGIPTPKTAMAFSMESAMMALDEIGYPAVLKPVIGSWGRFVAPLNDAESAQAMFETREYMHPLYQVYYIQERVKRPPRDIRVLVVGSTPIGASYRYAPIGDWRTNAAVGGSSEPCRLTKEIEDLSVRAAAATNAEIAGVDFMESESGPLVHEVNATTEFKSLAKATGINVPNAILDYLVSSYQR